LARALWIVPLALAIAAFKRRKSEIGAESETRGASKIPFPWFILFFCLAAIFNTYLPTVARVSHSLFTLGRLGLTATLFLIGTGISRATIKEVGWRPLLQGVLLWAVVGLTSLYFIRIGWIAL
jgi:uncharacterized membrane protein YadS